MTDPITPDINARYDAILLSCGVIDSDTPAEARRLARIAAEIRGTAIYRSALDRQKDHRQRRGAAEHAAIVLAEVERYLEQLFKAELD